MNVQQVISAIRQEVLKKAYKRLLMTEKRCKTKLKKATLYVEFAQEGQDTSHLKQAGKTTTAAYEKAKAKMAYVAEQVFQLYSNIISKKFCWALIKIMAEQIHATPWTDIQGIEQVDQCGKSWDSFMELRFHLLTILHNDAAETERSTSSTA